MLAASAGLGLVIAAAVGGAVAYRINLEWSAFHDSAQVTRLILYARTDAWRAQTRVAFVRGVVFGDSVLACPPEVFMPELERQLITRRVSPQLLDFSWPGLDSFHFYYWLGRILPSRPRFAVVEVNLRSFAPDWVDNSGLRRVLLSGGLGLRRTIRIREALAARQVSLLDPLVFGLAERLDMHFAADGVRVGVREALTTVGSAVDKRLGLGETPPTNEFTGLQSALDAETARAWYGQEFDTRPPVAVLRAMLAELREAGVVIQLLVAPVNLEALRRVAPSEAAELARRTARLREAIGARPEEWFDPSPEFPDGSFFDRLHLGQPGQRHLADLLAQQVATRLRETAPPAGR